MYYIYDKAIVLSILESLHVKKYIKQQGKLYEFYICNNNLILNIFNEKSPLLCKTYQVEKNVKGEFGICEDDRGYIHIIVANKKYDLIHICYDGSKFQKETIYYFSHNTGIPTMPVILAKNNLICIVLQFITFGKKKDWIFQCYIKRKGAWEVNIIDRGIGLCYIQPDMRIDAHNILHLVYREYKEKSVIKYTSFDTRKSSPEKKLIFDNGNNKYTPRLFYKESGAIFITWLELSNTAAYLCCTNISLELNREVFRVDISDNISDVSIHFKGSHVYCIFTDQDSFYYDMCCKKKLDQSCRPNLSLQGIYM